MPLSPAVRRQWRELTRTLLDAVLPPGCPGCGAAGEGLCAPCRRGLEPRAEPVCRRCGTPLPVTGRCPADHRPLRGLSWARAPFAYRGTGGLLVRRNKFDVDRGAERVLVAAMAGAAAAAVPRAGRRRWRVVAVPLHRARRRARGRDQAADLAGAVAARLRIPAPRGVLVRTRPTLPQGDPRVTDRDRNVDGAFAVRRRRAVAGRRVLLVDDVMTSGSTARACAAVLRAAGAREVALLTAARA